MVVLPTGVVTQVKARPCLISVLASRITHSAHHMLVRVPLIVKFCKDVSLPIPFSNSRTVLIVGAVGKIGRAVH